MYNIGKFYQAADVEDVMHALVKDPEAVVISGGNDMLAKIREGKLAGCSLVGIHGIKELEGVGMEEDGTVVIDPATTFSHIANNDIVRRHIPMPGDAMDTAGGPQLRGIGTMGGSVCNGMTSADSTSSLCCLDAVLILKGPDSVREVPISQWYTRPGGTIRNHDKMLTAIRIKKGNYQGYDGHHIKYGKESAVKIATLGCAVSVKLTGDRRYVQDLHLGYGVAVPTPIHRHKTEGAVKGMETGEALTQTVGKSALKETNPRSGWRTSREFRLQLVEELGRRAVKQTIINAGGEWDA